MYAGREIACRTHNRLLDPPRGVRREPESFGVIEFFGGGHKSDRPDLNEVVEVDSSAHVFFRYGHDESEVTVYEFVFCRFVAVRNTLGEFYFLVGGKKFELSEPMQKVPRRVSARSDVFRFVRFLFGVLAYDENTAFFEFFARSVHVLPRGVTV